MGGIGTDPDVLGEIETFTGWLDICPSQGQEGKETHLSVEIATHHTTERPLGIFYFGLVYCGQLFWK